MSNLGCPCGHVIRDQTDDLPYKGVIIRHKHFGAAFENVVEDVVRTPKPFVKAEVMNGLRNGWEQITPISA